MADISLQIEGKEELARKMSHLSKAVRTSIAKDAVDEGAAVIQFHAQLNARNKFSSRQRGQMRNSIRNSSKEEWISSKTTAQGAVAEVGPHTIYARIQEFGGIIYPRRASMLHWKDENGEDHFAKSVTIPARPYLRPAAEDHIDQISDVMRQAVEDGIKHNS